MDIVVTGARGQLGSELRELAARSAGNRFHFTDIEAGDGIESLDITDRDAVAAFLRGTGASVLVNCAAYTDVEAAEDNTEDAFRVNAEAPGLLASVCGELSVFMIHISTDYVFDGNCGCPYTEDNGAAPLSVYGESKLEGELAVAETECDYLIFRTSWLYSRYGRNFVSKMRQLFAERDCIRVVSDQTGTPTNAADLADFIFGIIEEGTYREHKGTYHYSDEGVCSWYDFAMAIRSMCGSECKIRPCLSKDYPTKAERPHFSVLDKTKVKTDFGVEIPYWRDSLERMMLSE